MTMYCRAVLVRADQYDTENFLAGMFYTQVEIDRCLNTPIFPEKMPAQHVAIAEEKVDENVEKKDGKEEKTPMVKGDVGDLTYLLENDAFEVRVTGALSNIDDSSIITKYFITYEFSITRLTDNLSQKIYRRFRDIKALYSEVSTNFTLPKKPSLM
jgi:hypothetical protein